LWAETTRILYDNGSEDWQRDPRCNEEPRRCSACPYGPGGLKPPIRTITVVRTVRTSQDEF
jgi:hypothetical protein